MKMSAKLVFLEQQPSLSIVLYVGIEELQWPAASEIMVIEERSKRKRIKNRWLNRLTFTLLSLPESMSI